VESDCTWRSLSTENSTQFHGRRYKAAKRPYRRAPVLSTCIELTRRKVDGQILRYAARSYRHTTQADRVSGGLRWSSGAQDRGANKQDRSKAESRS